MPPKIVIDASVVVKWIAPEEKTAKALTIRDLHKQGISVIHVPTLLYYEITNMLANNIGLPLQKIFQFFEILEGLELKEEQLQFRQDYQEIAKLCQKYRTSSYDASYVYLAQKLNTDLITADRKLFGKTKKLGFVKLL